MYQAFAEKDMETIRSLFAPDIEWIQNPGFPDGAHHVGVESVINNVFSRFKDSWEDWAASIDEWLDAGESIIALGEYRGTFRATGKQMTAAFAHVYRLKDGKILRFNQYTDTQMIHAARGG